MMKIRNILTAIAVGIATSQAMGQQVLTLGGCRDLALKNNHLVEAASWQIDRAKAEVTNYKANFLPQLELSGTGILSTIDGSFDTPDIKLPVFLGAEITQPLGFALVPAMSIDYNMHSLWNAGISLTQPIYMGGKIKAGYDISKLSLKLADLNQRKTREDIILQSDEAYMTVVKCLELQKVAAAYTALINNVMKNVESAQKVGLKTRNDVMRVEVALGQCELAEAQAANGFRLACMNLCHVTGLPLDSEIAIVDTVPPVVTMSSIDNEYNIDNRPEYEMLELQSEIADKQVNVARSEMLPQVGLMLNYGILHGGKLLDETVFDKKLGFTGLLSVKIPLFSWGQHKAKVNSARAQYETTKAKQLDLNEQMMLEVMRNRNLLHEAILESDIARRNLQQTEENLRISEKSFLAGTTTLSDHLEANLLWLQASQRLVETRYAAYIALVRYNKSRGKSL